jgi:type IV secretion system protein VirB9
MIVRTILLLAFTLAAAGVSIAQSPVSPVPGPGDPRIRELLYDPDQVIDIKGQLGFEMTIEFDPEERIETVSIGDSLSWQVTPNRKATLLFLKPMALAGATSMTVATSKRLYSFVLTVVETTRRSAPPMLRLRLLYPAPPEPVVEAPPPPPPPPPSPDQLNFSYTFKGARAIQPARVFDDGASTYFEFVADKDTPAIFVIGPDGKEEMASTRISGRYTVTDIHAERFVLRYGKAKLDVLNAGWSASSAKGRVAAPAPASEPPAATEPTGGGR